MNRAPLLETRHVVKRFGGVTALKSVSLTVDAGTVHGLLGENGAGKSTLVKIVAGLHVPTEGEVLLDGVVLGAVDVKAMESHGVFLVTQEPAIVNPLSVAENLMLGRWPHRGPWVDIRGMRRLAGISRSWRPRSSTRMIFRPRSPPASSSRTSWPGGAWRTEKSSMR